MIMSIRKKFGFSAWLWFVKHNGFGRSSFYGKVDLYVHREIVHTKKNYNHVLKGWNLWYQM